LSQNQKNTSEKTDFDSIRFSNKIRFRSSIR